MAITFNITTIGIIRLSHSGEKLNSRNCDLCIVKKSLLFLYIKRTIISLKSKVIFLKFYELYPWITIFFKRQII